MQVVVGTWVPGKVNGPSREVRVRFGWVTLVLKRSVIRGMCQDQSPKLVLKEEATNSVGTR